MSIVIRQSAVVAAVLVGTCLAAGCSSASEDGDAPVTTVASTGESRTVSANRLTADAAETAARAALTQCAADGHANVSVSVVDRNGDLQAYVRGDNAAAHTEEASRQKGYTAAAFGANTSDLVQRADDNGLHRLPGTLFMAGGVPVKLGDATIAGIGVGGAPSGNDDQTCAAAGLASIEDPAAG